MPGPCAALGASRAELFAALDAPALRGCRRALRLRPLETLPGRPGLPRRGRGPLVLGAVPPDPPGAGRADGRGHGGGFPPRRAGGQPPAGPAAAGHTPCPSTCRARIAGTPSGRLPGCWRRRPDRPCGGGAVRGGHGGATASRAGLPHLPRHPGPGQDLRSRPARRRLRARCQHPARARSASIRSILQNGLERAFLEEETERRPPPPHGNIRGGGYFH